MGSDRRRGVIPRDPAGEHLIDAGALLLALRDQTTVRTARDLRRWVRKHDVQPIRRGAHGAHLYRWADILDVLDRHDEVG